MIVPWSSQPVNPVTIPCHHAVHFIHGIFHQPRSIVTVELEISPGKLLGVAGISVIQQFNALICVKRKTISLLRME